LVGVDELVREVLLGGVFPHLDSRSSDYPRVAGARLRLHPKELPEQDPVGLDPCWGVTRKIRMNPRTRVRERESS
jgi:hypothetical protein